jgi:hypothetical protein
MAHTSTGSWSCTTCVTGPGSVWRAELNGYQPGLARGLRTQRRARARSWPAQPPQEEDLLCHTTEPSHAWLRCWREVAEIHGSARMAYERIGEPGRHAGGRCRGYPALSGGNLTSCGLSPSHLGGTLLVCRGAVSRQKTGPHAGTRLSGADRATFTGVEGLRRLVR